MKNLIQVLLFLFILSSCTKAPVKSSDITSDSDDRTILIKDPNLRPKSINITMVRIFDIPDTLNIMNKELYLQIYKIQTKEVIYTSDPVIFSPLMGGSIRFVGMDSTNLEVSKDYSLDLFYKKDGKSILVRGFNFSPNSILNPYDRHQTNIEFWGKNPTIITFLRWNY